MTEKWTKLLVSDQNSEGSDNFLKSMEDWWLNKHEIFKNKKKVAKPCCWFFENHLSTRIFQWLTYSKLYWVLGILNFRSHVNSTKYIARYSLQIGKTGRSLSHHKCTKKSQKKYIFLNLRSRLKNFVATIKHFLQKNWLLKSQKFSGEKNKPERKYSIDFWESEQKESGKDFMIACWSCL